MSWSRGLSVDGHNLIIVLGIFIDGRYDDDPVVMDCDDTAGGPGLLAVGLLDSLVSCGGGGGASCIMLSKLPQA